MSIRLTHEGVHRMALTTGLKTDRVQRRLSLALDRLKGALMNREWILFHVREAQRRTYSHDSGDGARF
jgi:hypothetical protein